VKYGKHSNIISIAKKYLHRLNKTVVRKELTEKHFHPDAIEE